MSPGIRTLLAASTLASFVTATAPAYAQSSPVEGSWDLIMTMPIGERKSTMTVTPTDGTFTISFAFPEGGAPVRDTISEIRIEGSTFAFKRSVEIEQGLIELNYAGTVDGSVLTGKVKSQFGEFDLKGSRSG